MGWDGMGCDRMGWDMIVPTYIHTSYVPIPTYMDTSLTMFFIEKPLSPKKRSALGSNHLFTLYVHLHGNSIYQKLFSH